MLRGERTIQTNFDKTDLLTGSGQVVDDFFRDVAEGTHRHDDAIRVGSAVVVEQLIVGAQLLVDLAHVLFNDTRNGIIVLVAGLAMLEEDVAVRVRTAHHGMLGVQSTLAERRNRVHIAHLGQIVVVPDLDLLDLVRGAETVE